MTKLEEVLSGRPRWVRTAALRLSKASAAEEVELSELIALCEAEAEDSETVPDADLSGLSVSEPATKTVRLDSVGPVSGINRLALRKPLQFGNQPLTVVYGRNGTGKTGIVRILKNVCGARDPGPLKPDVSAKATTEQTCRLDYRIAGRQAFVDWEPQHGALRELGSVDIFDSREAWVFVTDENEVTYEPRLLRFLTDLISICDRVRRHFNAEIATRPRLLPVLPERYRDTSASRWYGGLSSRTDASDIEANTRWSEDDQQRLLSLSGGEAPGEKAQAQQRRARNLGELVDLVEQLEVALSVDECMRLRGLWERANALREAAELAASVAFADVPLDGVGTPVWRELWQHARTYSLQQAYPEKEFPNTGPDSRCVLCQQSLSPDGVRRMTSFEDFVKGEAEANAQRAAEGFAQALEKVELIPGPDVLATQMDAAGLEKGLDRRELQRAVDVFRSRLSWISLLSDVSDPPELPDLARWVEQARAQIESSNRVSAALLAQEDSGAGGGRGESDRIELMARQWVSGQTDTIESEVTRLKELEVLEAGRNSAATTGLSTKRGELAQELITDAFAEDFKNELVRLGAGSLQAELKKTRTAKGHTLHRLEYHGVEGPMLRDVLSEGEFRVVSLATCLADAAGNDSKGPFVFDDPISSLDQDFEEAVVARLVEVARDRQVIVFTHRLSLLNLLEDAAKKESVGLDVTCVRAEPWGVGVPGGVPVNVKKPEGALINLKNGDIPRAKKVLEQDGQAAYYPHGRAMCSDFRILIERVVESHLLNDVVRRHRRSVQTDGRLERLPLIQKEDCDYVDDLMTKYSRYEHSQSREVPLDPPDPSDLLGDVEGLLTWVAEFKKRK